MNKAEFSTIIIVICFLLIAVLLFISLLITPHTEAGSGPLPPLTHTLPASTFIMSLEEIQLIIGAKPDGIYGKETKEKWDSYLANQYASKWFKADSYTKERLEK